MKQNNILYLDGNTLTPQQITHAVQDNIQVSLSQSAWEKVRKSKGILTEMLSTHQIIYGVNTGFGHFANKMIKEEEIKQLQLNLIRSHSCGVGKPISCDNARRMFLLRINTLAKGRSGISEQTLKQMIEAFNANVIPYVAEQGTVGASGDLCPLSYLALTLIGEGKAWCQQSQSYQQSKPILTAKGLSPLNLNVKEGLCLINGTQFISALLSQSITKAQKLLHSALLIFTFAVQIFNVNHSLFSNKNIQYYSTFNAPMSQILQIVHDYLDDTPSPLHLHKAHTSTHPLPQSLLYFLQSACGTHKAILSCKRILTEEINAATDNPLIYSSQGMKHTPQTTLDSE